MTILTVSFYGTPIGEIDTNGSKHNWKSHDNALSRFLEGDHPGQIPNTFKFLQPEGWLAGVLSGQNFLDTGVRFLSNIAIVKKDSTEMEFIGLDALHCSLDDCTKADGVSFAKYCGPISGSYDSTFDEKIRNLWDNSLMPKFSGAQVKMPTSLLSDQDGGYIVIPAVKTTFSHILKLPREGFLESLPTVEWLGLELTQRAGLKTAKHALLPMPNGMAPALIVERFDIPTTEDNLSSFIRISDFCNITGKEPEKYKYGSNILDCFVALDAQSSSPEEDKISLFKRLVVSHYLCDSDMHLKNISVLKTLDVNTGRTTVTLSPAYDSMTTDIYEELSDKKSALCYVPKMQLEDCFGVAAEYELEPVLKHIENMDDLVSIAEQVGISANKARHIIYEISQSIVDNAVEIAKNPPEIIKYRPICLHALKCAVTAIVAKSDAPNCPKWTNIYPEDNLAPFQATIPFASFKP